MEHENDVVIVIAVRSAFSRFGGALRNVHSMSIAASQRGSFLFSWGITLSAPGGWRRQ